MEKIAIILIVLLIVGCGTRKNSQTKIQFKSDTLSVNNSIVLKQNLILNDIYQLKPFDASKPMVIDGKEYFNVSIVYDKSKFDNFEIDKIYKLDQGAIFKDEKAKETVKTDNTILYSSIFFIACLFVFLWLYLKKSILAH